MKTHKFQIYRQCSPAILRNNWEQNLQADIIITLNSSINYWSI